MSDSVNHKLLMQQTKIMLTAALQPSELEPLLADYQAAGLTIAEWLEAVQGMSTMLEIATDLAESIPPERETTE